jgi:hypothetical protein
MFSADGNLDLEEVPALYIVLYGRVKSVMPEP